MTKISTRLLAGPGIDLAELMTRFTAGESHHSLWPDRSLAFVPLFGLQLPDMCAFTGLNEYVLTLDHVTWRGLESLRHRDIYNDVVLHFPPVFFVRMIAPDITLDDFARPGAEGEMGQAAESIQIAMLVYADGGLVSPHRVPWILCTADGLRYSLEGGRFRLYRFVPSDIWMQIGLSIEVDGQEETYSSRAARFDGVATRPPAVDVPNIIALHERIQTAELFRRQPAFRALCRLYAESRDLFLREEARDMRFVVAFERIFGPLTLANVDRTVRRLNHVLALDGRSTVTEAALSGAFRVFRNEVSHGKSAMAEAATMRDVVDRAIRTFILNAVRAFVAESHSPGSAEMGLPRIKRRVFAEA